MLLKVHFQKYRSITITGQVEGGVGGGGTLSYNYPSENYSKIWVFSTVEKKIVLSIA